MAVVGMEGFDHLSFAQHDYKQGWSIGTGAVVAGRFGGQAIRCNANNSSTATLTLPSTYSELYAGFALRQGTLPGGGQHLFAFVNGATNILRMLVTTSGAEYVWYLANSAGTVLGTTTTPIVVDVWYYVEIKCIVSATVGQVELRINGSTTPEIATAANVNTGSTAIAGVLIRTTSGSATTNFCDFDDMYVVDTSGSAPTNTWLGETKVETLYPSSNGSNTAWTGVYTDVDDPATYDGDTTYISSSTPGDKETYGMTNLSPGTGTVFAVQTNVTARKDDAGARTIAPILRTGGTDYAGTTSPSLGSDYMDYKQLYERLDPVGNAWSIATVNAMEAGVKEVA